MVYFYFTLTFFFCSCVVVAIDTLTGTVLLSCGRAGAGETIRRGCFTRFTLMVTF